VLVEGSLGRRQGTLEVVMVQRGLDDLVAVAAQLVGFTPPTTEFQPWR
jgi:hypothetical protein